MQQRRVSKSVLSFVIVIVEGRVASYYEWVDPSRHRPPVRLIHVPILTQLLIIRCLWVGKHGKLSPIAKWEVRVLCCQSTISYNRRVTFARSLWGRHSSRESPPLRNLKQICRGHMARGLIFHAVHYQQSSLHRLGVKSGKDQFLKSRLCGVYLPSTAKCCLKVFGVPGESVWRD